MREQFVWQILQNKKKDEATAVLAVDDFLADIFAVEEPPASVQAVADILPSTPEVGDQEVVRLKTPEEVLQAVESAYTQSTPEQFVGAVSASVEARRPQPSGRAREVVGEPIDGYCRGFHGLNSTPRRGEGYSKADLYWDLRDSFEQPATACLERFEATTTADIVCVEEVGHRLRTLVDLESEASFVRTVGNSVPDLTTEEIAQLDDAQRQQVVDLVRRQTVEDISALATTVLREGRLHSAGVMLALLPEVVTDGKVQQAFRALVTRYKNQPGATTDENSPFQRLLRTSNRIREALKGDGLVVGNVIVREQGEGQSGRLAFEPFDNWDPTSWQEKAVVDEAGALASEFRHSYREGQNYYRNYTQARNTVNLDFAWASSGRDRTTLSRIERTSIWRM